MANQLLQIESLTVGGEPVSPFTTSVIQIPRSEMGKPIAFTLKYRYAGEPAGSLKVRITGSHLEPTHAVVESPGEALQHQGEVTLSFAPNAYGVATLFVFVDEQPLHISMFRLGETEAGSIQVISGPSKPVEFEELPLPEDVEIS